MSSLIDPSLEARRYLKEAQTALEGNHAPAAQANATIAVAYSILAVLKELPNLGVAR